jgi:hypothetical protein
MSRWYAVPTALLVLAVAAPANADWPVRVRGVSQQVLTSLNRVSGEPVVVDGDMYGGTYMGMAPQGYPFYSGCCEPRSSCCQSLWSGFCFEPRGWCHRRAHSHCGCGVSSCDGCGKGKGGWSGSCGCAAPSYGCGHHGHGRRLFGWRHRHGCGYDSCGDCSVGCGKGKGKYGSATSTDMTVPMYDTPSLEVPPPDAPMPPPVSDQSADSRWSPSWLRNRN